VLGLDGATWDLLNPLMDQGVMPNLQKIVDGGASGILESTVPPYTAPAWVSCLTGVNPGKHGVFGFVINKHNEIKRRFIDSSDIEAPRLWHYVNAAGKSAGMINIPVTYPPEPVRGFMVSDFLTPLGREDYTYPASIYGDYLKPMDYVINVRMGGIQNFSQNGFMRVMENIKECTLKRQKAMRELRKEFRPDFFMIVFTCMDKIQHEFYQYLDRESGLYNTTLCERMRPHLVSIYRQMDEVIGEILEEIGSHTALYIVSDHGFCSMEKHFYINKWLHGRGYLSLKKLNLIRDRFLFKYIKKASFSDRNIDVFSPPVHKYIRFKESAFLGSDPYEQAVYYIGNSGRAGYLEQVAGIKRELEELKDVSTGANLFEKVYHRDDLYTGSFKDRAPDLLLKMRDYRCGFATGYPLRNHFLLPAGKPSGTHHPAGIFAAYGAEIARGRVNASIMDIAPTVLFNMGLPVHREMDGRPLREIFSENFLKEHITQYGNDLPAFKPGARKASIFSDGDKEEMAGRLRDLGYME